VFCPVLLYGYVLQVYRALVQFEECVGRQMNENQLKKIFLEKFQKKIFFEVKMSTFQNGKKNFFKKKNLSKKNQVIK